MKYNISITEEAKQLLLAGKLGQKLMGKNSYIPNCSLELHKGRLNTPYVKILNKKGIVIAQTEGVTFPKNWEELIDIKLANIAFGIDIKIL